MKKLIIVLFFTLSQAGLAQADLTQFCTEVQKELKENKLTTKEMIRDVLTLTYKPATYGAPVNLNGESELEKGQKASENLILTIDSLMKETDADEFQKQKELYKSLNKKINKQFRLVRHATKERKTPEMCAKELKHKGFKLDHFYSLQAERNRLFDVKISYEAKILNRVLPKRFLKNDWTLRSSLHVEELLQTLQTTQTTNLIFITHATPAGQLLDSRGNILPKNLFKKISSSVKTLAIYSCHSLKVREFYELDKLNLNSTSLFVAKESEYLGQKEVAPLEAASHFIRKIDRFVFDHKMSVTVSKVPKLCTLHLSGIKSSKVDFGLFHRTTFIGSLKVDEENKIITFDCDDLTSKSTFGLRSMSLLTTGELKLGNAEISLKMGPETVRLSLQPISNEQGQIQVLKAKIP